MGLEFANAWVLYFVWVAPALGAWWYLAARRRQKALDLFVTPALQKKLSPPHALARLYWQMGLTLAGLTAGLLAAARPQWGLREETAYERGRDLVIALDVSRSMLAADVRPNRLQRAKADILDLIKELRGDRAALVTFRRKANVVCPLTTDYAFLTQVLDGVDVDSAPPGETDLGDAIQKALEILENDQGAHKALILISDGEDLLGRALTLAEQAAKRNIRIFTVGIGSRQGAPVPDPTGGGRTLTYRGSNVTTRLNNETLYAIAKATGGAYIPLETAGTGSTTLGTLYRDHLLNLAEQDFREILERRKIDRFQWFLLPGVLCLIGAAGLSRGRLKIRGRASSGGRGVVDTKRAAGGAGTEPAAEESATVSPPNSIKVSAAALLCMLAVGMPTVWSSHAWGATNIPPSPSAEGTNALPAVASVPPGREGARRAQRLYLRGKYEEAAAAYLEAARGVGGEARKEFFFNAAAALFRAGKYMAAAEILRGLAAEDGNLGSAAQAALGLALFRGAEADKETDPENLARKAALFREAGEAFRAALRKQPDDEPLKRNLEATRAALRETEEQAKISRLIARYAQTPPGALAHQMLINQRAVNAALPQAFTNQPPERIKALETLAELQNANADLWIPLKGKIMDALNTSGSAATNQQLMATLHELMESTRENMLSAAARMQDLDPGALQPAALSEAAVYQMWKAIAAYPELLSEDIWRQTNVIALVEMLGTNSAVFVTNAIVQQNEAAELTRLFAERFSQAVPEGGSGEVTNAMPGDAETSNATNDLAPAGISAETRTRILELAREAHGAQVAAGERLQDADLSVALAHQRHSHELLLEIQKLLPREHQQAQGEEKQQDKSEEQSEEQKGTEQQQREESHGSSPEHPWPESDQQPQPQQQAEPRTPEEIRKVLEKALQREKEYMEDLRRRAREIPAIPSERDW